MNPLRTGKWTLSPSSRRSSSPFRLTAGLCVRLDRSRERSFRHPGAAPATTAGPRDRGDRRAVAALGIEVARHARAVERRLRRDDLRADRHRERAARGEATAGRWVAQVWRRSRDDVERAPIGPDVRERARAASGCRGGAAGGRPRRHVPSSATRPAYMIRTRSHVSAITDRSWVISTSDRPSLRRRTFEELQDLGLDHHVEGRRRLVADDDRRVAGEGHRDHRPLAHAARQLVGIGAAALARDARPARGGRPRASGRVFADTPSRCSIGSAIWSLTRWTGFRAFIAPWNTIEISRQR